MQNDLGTQMVELRLGAWPRLIQFYQPDRRTQLHWKSGEVANKKHSVRVSTFSWG